MSYNPIVDNSEQLLIVLRNHLLEGKKKMGRKDGVKTKSYIIC